MSHTEMKSTIFFVLVLLTLSVMGIGQVETYVPNGKPVLRVYSNFHTTFAENESQSTFELTRVYLGYEHNFSAHLYGMANLDVGNPGAGKHEMAAFVKNAYLSYRNSKLMVNFGMIATTQFKVQEGAWGYRYMEKSFQDAYKFNASADLGASVAYKLTSFLSADVIIANGEGYKKIQADSTLRTGFGVTLTPVEHLTGRVYYDFSTREYTQSSIAAFLGYASDRFNLNAEYMKQLNTGFVNERELNGLSFYGTLIVAQNWRVLARYDHLSSNLLPGETDDWNLSSDGQLFLAGIEFAPAKGIKLAPNFRGWRPADAGEGFITSVYLNCEIKF